MRMRVSLEINLSDSGCCDGRAQWCKVFNERSTKEQKCKSGATQRHTSTKTLQPEGAKVEKYEGVGT